MTILSLHFPTCLLLSPRRSSMANLVGCTSGRKVEYMSDDSSQKALACNGTMPDDVKGQVVVGCSEEIVGYLRYLGT